MVVALAGLAVGCGLGHKLRGWNARKLRGSAVVGEVAPRSGSGADLPIDAQLTQTVPDAPLAGPPENRMVVRSTPQPIPPGIVYTVNSPSQSTPNGLQPSYVPADVVPDVQVVDGQRLYLINAYRGLLIYDVQDPDRPSLLGRVSLDGRPVALFLQPPARLLVIVLDVERVLPPAASPASTYFLGHQLVDVDVSQPASPLIAGRLDLPGPAIDGRLRGDVLYIGGGRDTQEPPSSQRPMSAYVASYDVAAGHPPQPLDMIRLTGRVVDYRMEADAIIALMRPDTGYGTYPSYTNIRYIEASGPGGALLERGMGQIEGVLPNSAFVGRNGSDLYTVSLHADGHVHLSVVDLAQPARIRVRASNRLPLVTTPSNGPYSKSLDAVVFRGTRALVAWSSSTYDLRAVDFAAATGPQVTATLHMQQAARHMEWLGDRLWVTGQRIDTTGRALFGVALFDVADPVQLYELSHVDLPSGGWLLPATLRAGLLRVSSDLVLLPYLDHYPQALYLFHSRAHLDYSRGASRLQLVERVGDRLFLRGALAQSGAILDSFILATRAVMVSSYVAQTLDLTDPQQPKRTASWARTPDVLAVLPLQPALSLRIKAIDYAFRLEAVAPGDIEGPALGQAIDSDLFPWRVATRNNLVAILGWDPAGQARLDVFTVTLPDGPKLQGALALPWGPAMAEGSGDYLGYTASRRLPMQTHDRIFFAKDDILVIRTAASDSIHLLDLSRPSRPALMRTERFSDWTLLDVFFQDDVLYYSFRSRLIESQNGFDFAYALLGGLDLADPARMRRIQPQPIPGVALGLRPDGRRCFTICPRLGVRGSPPGLTCVFHLQVLDVVAPGSTLSLRTAYQLPDESVNHVRMLDDRALMVVPRYRAAVVGAAATSDPYLLFVLDTASGSSGQAPLPGPALVQGARAGTVVVGLAGDRRSHTVVYGFCSDGDTPIAAPAPEPGFFGHPARAEATLVFDLQALQPTLRSYLRGIEAQTLAGAGARAHAAGYVHGAVSIDMR